MSIRLASFNLNNLCNLQKLIIILGFPKYFAFREKNQLAQSSQSLTIILLCNWQLVRGMFQDSKTENQTLKCNTDLSSQPHDIHFIRQLERDNPQGSYMRSSKSRGHYVAGLDQNLSLLFLCQLFLLQKAYHIIETCNTLLHTDYFNSEICSKQGLFGQFNLQTVLSRIHSSESIIFILPHCYHHLLHSISFIWHVQNCFLKNGSITSRLTSNMWIQMALHGTLSSFSTNDRKCKINLHRQQALLHNDECARQ